MSFGERLRQERRRHHMSQEALAEALGCDPRTISRWEQGQVFPQAHSRLQLSRVFGLRPGELFAKWEEQMLPDLLWHVPYARNLFFTGREEILSYLYEQLHREHTMALTQSWAISGLGGIGKTQVALEYAYRYRQDYRFVFWTSAATREMLQTGIMTIADLLQLPERNEHDQSRVLLAVKQWLATHQEWLWVLDNVDDIAMVHEVIPTECAGHLLFTSRLQSLGSLAQRIDIDTMGMVEGTLFLLRRAKLLAPDAFLDQVSEEVLAAAEAIALEMDLLPLALDQAGAFIEEVGCSLSTYLQLYRTHRKELLQRRGHVPSDHPEPVVTTWSLSFQQVEQANPAAAELLRLCAFLEPDAIPETLIGAGSMHLGSVLGPVAADALALNEAIKELRKFSLVQRNPETRTLRIHRLVQVVLKDSMEAEAQRQWAERAVQATHTVFPETVEMATWPQCRSYLSQVQVCSMLIQDYALAFEEAASLLFRAATFLQQHALYEQAEPLYQRALSIREQVLGVEHPDVAQVLNRLATLYKEQDRYVEAESLHQRALGIWEQALGSDHLDLSAGLFNLAELYAEQDKLEQAEPLFQRALRIREQALGLEHPEVASVLIGLARFIYGRGKFEQAEPLFRRALRIREQTLGLEHPEVASVLIGLARLVYRQGKFEQAEPLFQRTLRIREQTLGLEHPEVASVLNNLASLYTEQSKYEQAEPLFQRALYIREQALGPKHRDVASVLHNLAEFYKQQGKFEQAEPLLQRALDIWTQILGPNHRDVAFGLQSLADLYREQGKFEQAASLYGRALHIHEQALGPEHPLIAYPLTGLANLYCEQSKFEQAEPLYLRALSIREHHLPPQHPNTAETLHDFAVLQETQGHTEEAVSLYRRALTIREQVFGLQDAKTNETRERLLALLQTIGKGDEPVHR